MKLKTLATLVAITAIGSPFGAHAQDSTYSPNLPKVSPMDGAIVIDLAQPEGGQVTDKDMRATLLSFQGLINRTESKKIYFKSMPVRVFQTGDERDHMSVEAGPGDPTQLWIDAGLIPGKLETPELDNSSSQPVFDYLWANYSHLIKGKILCSDFTKEPEKMGGRAAALTAATFEDALMVPISVDSYLTEKGIDLEVLGDTREMETVEAFNWSIEKYADHPKRNKQVVAFVGDINPPVMWDYWVATHTFSFWLKKSGPTQQDAVDPEFAKLLNADYYPQGVPVIGPVEGGKIIQRIQKLGYTSVCGLLPNASVTASIPTDPSKFGTAPEPKALELDPNGVYLSFNGPDGDALDFLAYIGFKGMYQDEKVGEAPVGWRVNPYFIDLFPTLYGFFSTRDPETIDIVGSMNDGGSSYTAAGQKGWTEQYRNYLDNSNGSMRLMNFLGGMYSATKPEILALEFDFVITGYQGETDKFEPEFKITDETLFSNQVGLRGHAKVSKPGGPESEDTLKYIRSAIEQESVDGEPFFIMGRLPSECGAHAFSILSWIGEELEKDMPKGRKLYFIPPRDLAATYKSWKKE
ncbi:MAG: hypothetical protein WA771_15855 [Chthoniobacterales bacterium]